MGTEFAFSVTLQIKHPELLPAEIAGAVGLPTKVSWSVGEPRKTPTGRLLQGLREESYCGFHIGGGDDGTLAVVLSKFIFDRRFHKEPMRKLRTTGGTLMLIVYWYPNGDTGEVFSVPLLRDMADFGIELGINVYDDRTAE